MQNNCDVGKKTTNGDAPLHIAAKFNKPESIKLLLRGRANVTEGEQLVEKRVCVLTTFHF